MAKPRAADAALRFLAERGHRHVHYNFSHHADWEARRAEAAGSGDLLARPGRLRSATYPRLRQACAPFAEGWAGLPAPLRRRRARLRAYFNQEPWSKLVRHPAGPLVALSCAFFRHGEEFPAEVRADVDGVWRALNLEPALLGPVVTAWIAGDDKQALEGMAFLARMGVPVPGRLPVLGFDHAYRYRGYPLTTVDMGFGPLGYQAFHLLLGDIPIRLVGPGRLGARPQVVG